MNLYLRYLLAFSSNLTLSLAWIWNLESWSYILFHQNPKKNFCFGGGVVWPAKCPRGSLILIIFFMDYLKYWQHYKESFYYHKLNWIVTNWYFDQSVQSKDYMSPLKWLSTFFFFLCFELSEYILKLLVPCYSNIVGISDIIRMLSDACLLPSQIFNVLIPLFASKEG